MASAESQLTPMMTQYRRIKGELPKDALLLFRLGDFYEMFFEDAQAGAQILNLALTARNGVPMCGLPHHAANAYIGRLLKAGRKVAICDQLEDARPGKLVKREVTQILSPGTHFDERMLVAERNNFLAAVCPRGKIFGLALVDLTTGDFLTTELEGDAALLAELERLRPAEIVYPGEATALRELLRDAFKILNGYDDWTFAPETAVFTVKEHFKVASLDGFGLKDKSAAIGAAGGALHYLTQHLRRDVKHLTRILFYQRGDFLALDYTTLRHLEILEPLRHDAPRNSSLYGAVNRTVTPMGARLLRHWLSQPLAKVEPICRRQDAVQSFIENSFGLDAFRQQLANVRDLERTIGRLSSGSGNARDLVALRVALEQLPTLKQTLATVGQASRLSPILETNLPKLREAENIETGATPVLLVDFAAQISESPDLVELISRAIVDDPPLAIKEGGMIRDGFDPALDELRNATRGGKDWIAKLQADEITRTGISSLKVRFNSVFGYYIEVTRANLDKVPAHYHRKQTIANGERFITPELKEMEGKILGAEERSVKLEYELFQRVREGVLGQLAKIQQTASALAQLDVLASFAETARLHNYVRPQVADEDVIQIRDGRHPVLEQNLLDERFVPNDTMLGVPPSGGSTGIVSSTMPPEGGTPNPQIALITGPNMAGKSTYIRQVALLTLLAHTGSFVPAAEARIDLVDRIFTRIGASDDLARGQSTFMVEMTETANILNNATPRSLIVLDEIGRGTSTFDGLSLAWSIVEHLHNQVGAKTLFATHYHELTELAARLPRLKNFNVAVREWREQVVFLHKIVEGGTDKSYGIQVARLAGVPKEVLERAKQILSNLEESELTPEGNVRQARRAQDRDKLKSLAPAPQMDLLGNKFMGTKSIAMSIGNGNIPLLKIQTPWSAAEIYLLGAHVTHFQKNGEPPLLFMSHNSHFAAGEPIRGGVPICFPWFGPREGGPAHGLARILVWDLVGNSTAPDGRVTARLQLSKHLIKNEWAGLNAEFVVTVADSLTMELVATNESPDKTLAIENCLHTYFQVGDINTISLSGLQGAPFDDFAAGAGGARRAADNSTLRITQETNRVYPNHTGVVEIRDEKLKQTIRVEKSNSQSTVVWNPWTTQKLPDDFDPAEHKNMVCVESGNVKQNKISLAPGKTTSLKVVLTSRPT